MRKRLYRSRTDRMLFGVAGGFAEWLDVDPAFVRIVWALLVLAGGAGFLLYIVAAIVVPEAPPAVAVDSNATGGDPAMGATAGSAPSTATRGQGSAARREGNGAVIMGGFLVLLGAWFFARNLLPGFDDRFVLPAFLVVLGAFLVLGSMRRR